MRDEPAPSPVRILGIDPGIGVTGYGVLELTHSSPSLIEAGVVRVRHDMQIRRVQVDAPAKGRLLPAARRRGEGRRSGHCGEVTYAGGGGMMI